MGRPKKGVQRRKKKSVQDDDEPEYLGHFETLPEPEQPLEETHQPLEETHQPLEETTAAEVDEEGPEGEIELSEEYEQPDQPKRKKQRGPTKMKHIAKDPNTRERVDFNEMGEAFGAGSVKLSSYLGPLVREHVPITIDDWRKISEEVKTVLWKSVQARFELDEEYQKTALIKQMGCLWRSSKSRLVSQIRNIATTNQQRMNLRPKNVSPTEWRKFVKLKTSSAFKAVSDQYKERRRNQIPHTCSRKGMVRLAEDMKKVSTKPSEVTRLKVWVKSRTKKDGTPVNTNAAEKFRKAAELVDKDASSTSTNPKEDLLSQLLGPDNPGRLRAMGRSMSMTKLACFQVQNKFMAEMQEKQFHLLHKVTELQDELAKFKNQRQEPEVGENSAAAKSVNKRAQPKCVLVDWSGTDENVAEGHILSSDPDDFVNEIPLGPIAVKVLVESATKPNAFLWRPAPEMFIVEEAVGKLIAWPANKCVLSDPEIQPEDIAPRSPTTDSLNKCKLLDWSTNDEVVAEGRWQSQEPKALVNGLPLGPNAVKIFVDVVHVHDTFLWRPTSEMTYLQDSLTSFVAWPANRVVFENTTDATCQRSPLLNSAASDKAASTKSASTSTKTAATPKAPVKKTQPPSESPLRRSQRNNPDEVPKENQKCKLMDITGNKRVVAEGRWASNNPDQTVHFVPLGANAVRVWVDIVKINNAAVWRPNSEIECMEDAIGTSIAWPEEKVIMF